MVVRLIPCNSSICTDRHIELHVPRGIFTRSNRQGRLGNQDRASIRYMVIGVHILPDGIRADSICRAFDLLQNASHHKPAPQNSLSSCLESLVAGYDKEVLNVGSSKAAANSRASRAPFSTTTYSPILF